MPLAVPRFKHGSSPWTILNSYAIPISRLGLQLNTSTLVLGSTGRVVPMAPSDDTNGVGGSHASCSWDGNTWFTSTINASYAPTSSSGFTFACRSVDLLGNEGPIYLGQRVSRSPSTVPFTSTSCRRNHWPQLDLEC